MKKINREPISRQPRDIVQDSREIREHLADLQETVGTLPGVVIELRASESASTAETIVARIPAYDAGGNLLGYIAVFEGMT